ncbi:cupredoxin family copper-binding protein [Methylocapsa polymorpha]|uniref:Cupredoxin family copper-binding protein n=1 Tax=Methylocapsa polymorpha TaxID=3080828 RepID=A0ABZ0HN17_9HYPH|nr:cupredoxin family copper-binding protein [Methylocapsa sp. RX1]
MEIKIDRRRFCAATASVGLAALPQRARAADANVRIDNFTFTPATLNVKPGAVVAWTNEDDIPHSIVAVDGKFHSPALDTGDAFSFTLTEPGAYAYYCGLHPHMKGTIIVVL